MEGELVSGRRNMKVDVNMGANRDSKLNVNVNLSAGPSRHLYAGTRLRNHPGSTFTRL